ncbi:hypothetical protein CISG_03787 [Coccidioides immitis RMSCC 3703]|uniref:Zn(2)-C6 fungal-type domain-containing protein n=1 Tax=Coccidioides immitis RMSCC 3703 TaxID=454286 RepID=A0A0J8TJ33_COCIT|nr:hypothetical protein CISG_03787 [Coccidioides immitis RMSCC 3703]
MAEKSSVGSDPAALNPPSATSPVGETSAPTTATSKLKGPRKRTKTGCLTCRKRRIKCGEEKPRCNNCIKSKRECEGYGQRVVFRDPVGPIPHLGPISSSQNLTGSGQRSLNRHLVQGFQHGEQTGTRAFLPLAPRPSGYGPDSDTFVRHDFTQHIGPQSGLSPSIREEDPYSWNAIHYAQPQPSAVQGFSQSGQDPGNPQFNPNYHPGAAVISQSMPQNTESYQPLGPQVVHHPQFVSSSLYMDNTSLSTTDSGQCMDSSHYISSELGFGSSMNHGPRHATEMEPEVDLGAESDDLYDVETDEELEQSKRTMHLDPYGNTATMIPYQLMSNVGPFSTYQSYENVLTTYSPSPLASPLLDPQHFQIFHHFLTVVGPSISIFERHPFIPSVSMSSGPVPPEQQSLWTYTLPTMALENQGLLQAMLAFSCFHIAKTTNQPLTASFRHYHYALRRVGRAVGLPQRRKQIPTLAATLLLGFYEVMGAEHRKWNSHLAGAAHLIRDIDFAAMTRDIRAMRMRARSEQWLSHSRDTWMESTVPYLGSYFENDIFAPYESDLDMSLINTLTGKAINYDEFGRVDIDTSKNPKRDLTAKDVEDYRVRCDLYWWYCKQDVFYSMVSGNALLFPHGRWGECPPRAGVGKLDAAYGSMDHLILLLARISTFVAKDRKRKLKVIDANGGEWRPPPNLFPGMGGAGQQPNKGPQSAFPQMQTGERPSAPKRETSPPMYGMVPPSGPIRLPSAFGNSTYPSPPSPSGSEGRTDVNSLTAEAEAEWQELVHASDEFEKALATPGFVPLPPDGAPLTASPFGPAIQYRTHIVACIWAFYYVARIILERGHPAMPPATMVAAGVAAPRTARYAQLIGRVTAGVPHLQQAGVNTPNLHPTTVGVLNELMLPLFFAGVQYSDPAQRTWTITKLLEIARITGGTSAALVASGCEKSWVKAYEVGRGPPYKRTVFPEQGQQNLQGNISESREDRRFVTLPEQPMVTFAMGLLSLDENLKGRELD